MIAMMRTAVILWIFSAVVYVGRGDNHPCHVQGATEESFNRFSLVISANNDFAFRLYRELASPSDSQEENIFFSPVSVSIVLAALSVGARGETHRQLFDGLGFNNFNLSQTDVDQGFCRILRSRQAREDISAGTAVFVDDLFKPQHEFLDVLKYFYSTPGFTVDFSKPTDTINIINKYVSDQTNGQIKQVVDSLDPSTVLYLLSSIYYKGKWVTAFNPALTKLDEFHVAENETVSVQMMKTEESFYLYDEAINTSVLHLPFNNSYSMLLLMPDDMTTLENVISPAHVTEWRKWMKPSDANIYIPKLSVKTSYTLNEVLKEMGMTDMFDHADLSGISKLRDLAVSEVVHRAALDVDEAGATAAAATGVAVLEMAYLKTELKYNRPFMLMIIERRTENILFIGKIVNPSL